MVRPAEVRRRRSRTDNGGPAASPRRRRLHRRPRPAASAEWVLIRSFTARPDRRLVIWFAFVVAFAALFIVGAALMIAAGPIARVRPLAVLGFVGIATVASWFMPHLRVGGSRHGQSLTDVAIIFGLMTLPWPWVVVAIAIGTPIGKFVARFSPGRIVFSAAK